MALQLSSQLELDQSHTGDQLDCLVCFETFPFERMVCCNAPVIVGNAETSADNGVSTSDTNSKQKEAKSEEKGKSLITL